MLNKMKRCLTGEAKMDKIYKSEEIKKDIKKWAKNR